MNDIDDARPESRTFLVERYWPDVDEARARVLACSLGRIARAMTAEGVEVAHLESILMVRDGVVFSLITATDEASARQLIARVGAPADRIAVAVRLKEEDPCIEG
jgi:hypothetical protein